MIAALNTKYLKLTALALATTGLVAIAIHTSKKRGPEDSDDARETAEGGQEEAGEGDRAVGVPAGADDAVVGGAAGSEPRVLYVGGDGAKPNAGEYYVAGEEEQ